MVDGISLAEELSANMVKAEPYVLEKAELRRLGTLMSFDGAAKTLKSRRTA
jgi:hypothetical protein